MSTTIQQVPAGTYNLDPVHSTFGFAVTHSGVSSFRGQFDQVDARLENGALVGTAQVGSVSTPIPQLKEHLLAPDFFDAANAPTVS
jgi:polyisoprenoid-binding protein YceI